VFLIPWYFYFRENYLFDCTCTQCELDQGDISQTSSEEEEEEDDDDDEMERDSSWIIEKEKERKYGRK